MGYSVYLKTMKKELDQNKTISVKLVVSEINSIIELYSKILNIKKT